MRLASPSLDWMRNLHRAAQTPNERDGVDLVDSARVLGLMAHTTPAWTESCVAVLTRLIEADPTWVEGGEVAGPLLALVGVRSMIDTSTDPRREQPAFVLTPDQRSEWLEVLDQPIGGAVRTASEAAPEAWGRLLAGPLEPCPQIVDVDFPKMGFDRAEWVDGNLHLGLAPAVQDPATSTTFRVVGAEPRIWDLHGVENARMESRLSGLNVRVPMVKADVTLIRSSY